MSKVQASVHPLDPLTPPEIERAVAIIRADRALPESTRFVSMSVAEPARSAVDGAPRRAEAVLYDAPTQTTTELRVDLDAAAVVDRNERTDVRPQLTVEDFLAVEAATKAHPKFVAAIERRGIDMALVDVDPVAAGFHDLPEEQGTTRLARTLAYVKSDPESNAYARPVQGVFGLMDVDTGEFVHFEDQDPVVPLPTETGEFRATHLEGLRDDVLPIQVIQPEGPSFTVEGNLVRWQKWDLRVGFNAREGLVLHQVGYDDDGRRRSILHRASYAEMAVPYADPTRYYMSPLDIGEFNVGTMTNSLTLGCDCLGVIRYFDGSFVSPSGEPVTIPNAICLHEEDAGMAWKHTDFRTGNVEVRRARRLVVSSVVTVGNYEYGFFWYFHQDGRISSEVKATGIVATQSLADGDRPEFGAMLAPNLGGIYHQHVFCVRLDVGLDGGTNRVVESHSEAVPVGPENPHGNAWRTVSTVLETEQQAQRQIDPFSARGWVVQNPSETNHVGGPVGYKLLPGDNTVPFSAPDSFQRQRARFMDHHLWVTRYSPDERYPAGEYPYQSRGAVDGLPAWTTADRSVDDEEIVVWYAMNHHHVPRPEDWPVMPVATIGFELKPWGFFDRSPSFDLPPSDRAHNGSVYADGSGPAGGCCGS